MGNVRPFLGDFYGTYVKVKILGLKAPGNYSASIWYIIFSILLLERAKNLNLGIVGRVQTTQNQLFLSLEAPGYHNKNQENQNAFLEILCLQISKFGKSKMLTCLEKTRAEQK